MRAFLLLLSTTLALPAFAQDNAQETQTVVVTGTPLRETKSRLAACLARKCPPNEDIDASLAHAENQFVAGDYVGARGTLREARGRNSKFAKILPTQVAGLIRAYGRMSDLDGHQDSSRLAQIDALVALRAGLDKGDARIFMQRLMVGDEYARASEPLSARNVYRSVARQGRKAGVMTVVGYAMFREAALYSALAKASSLHRSNAERQIARIERTREPELAPFRDAAKILRAQLVASRGDPDGLTRVVATVPPQRSSKPVLVYAPSIVLENLLESPKSVGGNGAPEWMDIRFRIAADGTVRGVETLRDSGNLSTAWPERVHRSIEQRRYVPFAPVDGRDEAVRIERFSYVHDVRWVTGSRLKARAIDGRITSLDLTIDPGQS